MGSDKKKVLFICVGNSARSQIAEELLRKYGDDYFLADSAGLHAQEINPYVIQVLKEDEDIDISDKKTQSVIDVFKRKLFFQYVITVCSRAEEEHCPVFPGVIQRLSWYFEDPAKFRGNDEKILVKVRDLKNRIKQKIFGFIAAEKVFVADSVDRQISVE
ncbi:MAG: arsenate reductase ArsC [Spirochaetales bacterium]|nr:arsenate reductase ArsC [Spirochaetales bacterium]